jgi:hypothetical protein
MDMMNDDWPLLTACPSNGADMVKDWLRQRLGEPSGPTARMAAGASPREAN